MDIFADLSIEEKVGQMFITTIDDTEFTPEQENLITHYSIGGLFLRANNLVNPKQAHKLIQSAQHYAKHDLPLFILTKQMGRSHNELTSGVIESPSINELLLYNNRLYTRHIAQFVAEELATIGINLNIAFSMGNLDLLSKNDSNHYVANLMGYEQRKVLSSVNNFPTLEQINKDKQVKYLTEKIINFSKVIKLQTLDPQLVTYLREVLNYQGLIMAEVPLVTDFYEFSYQAIRAGVDIIILPPAYPEQIKAIDNIIESFKTNKLELSKLEQTTERILQTKNNLQVDFDQAFNHEIFKQKRAKALVEKLMMKQEI